MEYDSPKFRKWLDKLQRESWQLELIISGFAIYGLITAYEPIGIKAMHATHSEHFTHFLIWSIAATAVSILIINLIAHVVLRGLWIGAIGLRYVSGDIDFDSLNYSEKFTRYLKAKVGSFDKFIAKLENFCSILFALSFLMIFYVLAFFAILTCVVLVTVLLGEIDFVPKLVKQVVLIVFVLFFIFGALLVFIDFIGQGVLKKRKWTSKLYFPFYRIFGIFTLSFLYRPLIYNFLDNKFSRRLSIYIVPFYIGLAFLSTFDDVSSNYLSNRMTSTEHFVTRSNYEASTDEKDQFINIASIPAKIIQTPYLKVFILYKKEMEDFIFEKNERLKPEKDNRGPTLAFIDDFKKGMEMSRNKEVEKDTILPQYLETFNSLYSLDIDEIKYESDFVVARNTKNQLGFETYLKIRNLSEGKHLLTIKGPGKKDSFSKESETIERTMATILFWYFLENGEIDTNNIKAKRDSTITE